MDKSHTVSALQLTRDLNTKDPHERARLSAKSEEFAIVGDRVLGQIAVTRCIFLIYFILWPKILPDWQPSEMHSSNCAIPTSQNMSSEIRQ